MARDTKNLISLCGWIVQGDLGPWTTYTSKRRRIVVYAKAPPLTPPTWPQSKVRLNFANASAAWSAMTRSAKDDWINANTILHSRMTGFNLWMWCALKDTDVRFAAVQNAINFPLQKPWVYQ